MESQYRVIFKLCRFFIDKKRKKERGYIHYILDNTFTRPPLTPHLTPHPYLY